MQSAQKKSTKPSGGRGGRGGRSENTKPVRRDVTQSKARSEEKPAPTLVKGTWRDKIPVTDQLDQVVDVIQKFKTSYVTAYAATDVVLKTIEVLIQNPQVRVIVCYSSKKVFSSIRPKFKVEYYKGGNPGQLNFNSQVIATTMVYARFLLEDIVRTGLTTHIFITGCQESHYTIANSAVLYSLIKYHEINARVIVHTASRWMPLPSNFTPSDEDSIVYTNNSVKFLYYNRQSPETLMSSLQGKVGIRGRWYRPEELEKYGVEYVESTYTPLSYDHVICDVRGIFLKSQVDLCANDILSGTIHVLANEADLKIESPEGAGDSAQGTLSRAVIWMDSNNIPLSILTKEYINEAKGILSPIPPDIKKEVISLNKKGLDIPASILNCRWVNANRNMIKKLLPKYTRKTNRTFTRAFYLPILVSCLINKPPSYYGDIQSLKSFQGRNDIEILASMWLDLINSHSYPFHLWNTEAKEGIIRDWCLKKAMNLDSISRTFNNISYFYNIALELLEEDARKYEKDFIAFINDFGALSTDELNEAMIQIKTCGGYTIINDGVYKTDKALLPNPRGNIIIVLHKYEKNVVSYISDLPLETRSYVVEDPDIFAPL